MSLLNKRITYLLTYLIKDCARGITLLKLTTDGNKASRGLSATAELLVSQRSGPSVNDGVVTALAVLNCHTTSHCVTFMSEVKSHTGKTIQHSRVLLTNVYNFTIVC